MPPLFTYLLLLSIGAYSLVAVADLVLSWAWRRFAIESVALVAVVGVLRVTTGFPATAKAFGGVSPLLSAAILFLCTIAGIAGHYFFYLRADFSWRAFLRPLFISPIVLLPLMGSLQTMTALEPVQLISFAFLAFQNGFFWRMVLERAKPASP